MRRLNGSPIPRRIGDDGGALLIVTQITHVGHTVRALRFGPRLRRGLFRKWRTLWCDFGFRTYGCEGHNARVGHLVFLLQIGQRVVSFGDLHLALRRIVDPDSIARNHGHFACGEVADRFGTSKIRNEWR
jgi:hypothetical protein